MTLEMLVFFLAGGLQFYGAWSIDFAWHGRETTGRVGLPFPGRLVYVSSRFWWWHAWSAMVVGILLLVLVTTPFFSLIGIGGLVLAGLGLVLILYPWSTGKGIFGTGYAATWNLAFFIGVLGGSVLMVLAP
jgi:hypothetical protein